MNLMNRIFWAGLSLMLWSSAVSHAELPRLGIIAEDKLKPYADLLSVRLTQGGNVALIERAEIDKAIAEQRLSADMGAESLHVGRLLRADGLLFLFTNHEDGIEAIRSRLVAVGPGIALAESLHAPGLPTEESIDKEFLKPYGPLFPKLSVLPTNVIRISFLGVHATLQDAESREAEHELSLLLPRRLMGTKDIFVLERSRMDDLLFEKDVATEGNTMNIWSGSHLLEGTLDRIDRTSSAVRVRMELKPPNNGPVVVVEEQGALDGLTDLVDRLSRAIAASLSRKMDPTPWEPLVEAAQYTELARWAASAKLNEDAARAADSAWALGDRSEPLRNARLRAYSSIAFPFFDKRPFGSSDVVGRSSPERSLDYALRSLEIASLELTKEGRPSDVMQYHLLACVAGASQVLKYFEGAGTAYGKNKELAQLKEITQQTYPLLKPLLSPSDQSILEDIRSKYGTAWGVRAEDLPPLPSPTFPPPQPTPPAIPEANVAPKLDSASGVLDVKRYISLLDLPEFAQKGIKYTSLSSALVRDGQIWTIAFSGLVPDSMNTVIGLDVKTGRTQLIPVPHRNAPDSLSSSSMTGNMDVTPSRIALVDRCFVLVYDRGTSEWRYLDIPPNAYHGVACQGDSVLVGMGGLITSGSDQDTPASSIKQGGILRVDPVSGRLEILASSVRRPPQTVLDGIETYDVYGLFSSADSRFWASVFTPHQGWKVRLFQWDGTDWKDLFPEEAGMETACGDSSGFLVMHQWGGVLRCRWMNHSTGQMETWLDSSATPTSGASAPRWIMPESGTGKHHQYATDGRDLFALRITSPENQPKEFELLWFRQGQTETAVIPLRLVPSNEQSSKAAMDYPGGLFCIDGQLAIQSGSGYWILSLQELDAWLKNQAGANR